MLRRRFLALGAATVTVSGCLASDAEDSDGTDAEDIEGTTIPRDPSRGENEANPSPSARDSGGSTGTSERQISRDRSPRPTATTGIGGSLNGRPHRLADNLSLIDRSDADWIHAFLDVRKKLEGDADPRSDPDVAALRRAGRETDVNLIVSLKWNFTGNLGNFDPSSLPDPGSARERRLVEYGTKLLSAIDRPVDVVVLGNEPIWETHRKNLVGVEPPLVRFTESVKAHVVEHLTVGDPEILVGAFNRLYDGVWKEYEQVYTQLFELARTDDDIDGVDLHVHYRSLREAEKMLDVARRQVPDGTVTVTEISPMFRYGSNVDEPLGSFEGGDRIAERQGVPADTTVTAFLEAAKDDRLSPGEMGRFMQAMPWYNVDFVADVHDLLRRFDVEAGTSGFLVEDDVDNTDWTEGWTPFPINCLFQPALIDSEDGAHPHYLEDVRPIKPNSSGN